MRVRALFHSPPARLRAPTARRDRRTQIGSAAAPSARELTSRWVDGRAVPAEQERTARPGMGPGGTTPQRVEFSGQRRKLWQLWIELDQLVERSPRVLQLSAADGVPRRRGTRFHAPLLYSLQQLRVALGRDAATGRRRD